MTSQASAGAESTAYRFDRFSTALLIDDMTFGRQAPGPGDPVSAFDLPTLDGGRFRSDDLGNLPVLLVIGSRTCPITESSGPVLRRLHAEFGPRGPGGRRVVVADHVMIPAAFQYRRPASVADAVDTLASLGEEAKVLAGGHSLLPLMRLRFAAPAALVDIGDLTELRFTRRDGDQVRIGALTRHRDLEEDLVVCDCVPLLALTAAQIGDPQIRNRGTIGGAVAHADPAGEYGTVCLMLDAEIVTTRRRIPAGEFFLGRFTTPLEHDELITELVFPVTGGGAAAGGPGQSGAAYLKFCHRLFDWALAGAAVQRIADGWRVGLVNMAQTPVRAVAVERALDDGASFAEAARLASDGLDPTPSLRAPAEYKLHLARLLTRRALEQAAAR